MLRRCILLVRVMLGAARHAAAGRCLSAHLLVIGLVLSQDLLAEFLLALVDIRVKLVSVLADRKLLVVVDRNEDLLGAHWFFFGVVKLSHVRVPQGFLRSQTLVRVEVKQVLH